MADENKQPVFTRRTWALLAVLVLLLVPLYYVWNNRPQATPETVAATAPAAGQPPAGQPPVPTPAPAQEQGAVPPPDQPVARDPFMVPVAYREANKQTEAAGQKTTVKGPPRLVGIVSSQSGKIAILESDGASKGVPVGGMYAGYTLVSLAENYAVVRGAEGSMTLQVGR